MNLQINPEEKKWLKIFYSGRNLLHWGSIERADISAKHLPQAMPWLTRLSSDHFSDYPIVLPLYEEGRITWYVMSESDAQFSQLTNEINAFVGPSYSDLNGEWAKMSDADMPEYALMNRFGDRVVKFCTQGSDEQLKTERALELYFQLLSRRPEIPDRTQRPFGKIRVDFDCALLAGNVNNANRFFKELCDTGRVNAEQKKCLEIRLLAGLGRQEEIAKNKVLLSSVADIPLPTQVLVDVVLSLYEIFIAPIENTSEVDEVISLFEKQISRPYGPLFRKRKGIRNTKVLRAFILFELAQGTPDRERIRSTLEVYPENGEGKELAQRWSKALQGDSAIELEYLPVEERTPLELAKQAFADEDYNSTVDLCFELIPEQWAYSALLRCVLEVESEDLKDRVLFAINAVSDEVRKRFSKRDVERLNVLEASTAPIILSAESGWVTWAKMIAEDPTNAIPVSELKGYAAKWSIDDYRNDPSKCASFLEAMGNGDEDAQKVYREAFPEIMGFFLEERNRCFIDIYSTLLDMLALSEGVSSSELEIASLLIESIFDLGIEHQVYTECLADLRELISENNSPTYFDWMLNVVELLALFPAPDGGALRTELFVMQVVPAMQAGLHRITQTQRMVLSLLAKDFGAVSLLDSFPEPKEDELEVKSENLSFDGLIGIYTLMEGAGKRAKELLEKLLPNARVETNKDGVTTERLTTLAKNADIFVFAWKASKHQAFYCVKNATNIDRVIMPSGKGTASIVREVMEAVSNL